MRRNVIFCTLFVTLFLISAFSTDTLNGSTSYRIDVGSSSSSPTSLFNFKHEIFENTSSLTVSVASINNITGEVIMGGGDAQRPTTPFTWSWGDGNISQGWFPQTHTYIDRTKNYQVNVTSHYSGGKTGSAQTIVFFLRHSVAFKSLSSDVTVTIPNNNVNLISRMQGYGIPSTLTYFNNSYFNVYDRSTVEYILTAAASIQIDFANDDICLINGGFNQVLLSDPSFGGMYSLWYTSPVSLGVGNYGFQGPIQWSSFLHEMGHDVSLNSPSNYYYGGKIDGNANAIFSESMAQIFQHATAYELINNAKTYGLSDDIVFDIIQSARSAIWFSREGYLNYVDSGMKFSSWNDPATPTDETYNTFGTIAYIFLAHAENFGSGYRIPLKRMMALLQTFREADRERYSQYSNTPTAETFRATLMAAALSYAFGEDLRTEFRDLEFPISDEAYTELVSRVSTSPLKIPSTISCSVSPSEIMEASVVPVTGRISAAVPDKNITLIYKSPDGSTFSRTATTDSSGSFSDSYKPNVAGSWSVEASWDGDSTYGGSESQATSFSVKPRIPSTISCSVSSSDIKGGESITVTGFISVTVSNTTVTLNYMKPDGTWLTRAVTTDSDGFYRDVYKPSTTGPWSVKASWDGDTVHQGASSSSTTFAVNKISSSLTFYVSPSSLVVGGSATFSGSINPPLSGVIVTISQMSDPQGFLTTLTTASDGGYSYLWTPSSSGVYQLEAKWNGDDTYGGAASNTVSITVVKISTTISCSVSPSEIVETNTITVTGHISATVPGKTVTLTYKKPDGSTLSTTVIIDSNGSYSDFYKPNVVGSWSVEASWDGDSTYGGSKSQAASFSVKPQSGGGIDGFSYETVVLGLVLAVLILGMFKHARYT